MKVSIHDLRFSRVVPLLLFCAILFSAQVTQAGLPGADVLRPAAEHEHETLAMLSEYLKLAALNNPELEAAFYRWKSALEKIPQARALQDPEFTFQYFLRSDAGRRPDMYGLMQKFPWFGVLDLQGEIAGRSAAALKAEYDALMLRIAFEVKETFYELAYLANAIQTSKKEIELVRYLESTARARYAAGSAPYDELIRLQVQIGRQENNVRTLEDMTRPIMARLAAILNQPARTEFPMPSAVPVMVMTLSEDEILKEFPESSPEIKRYEHLEAMENAGVELGKKRYYPEFTLGIEYENAMREPQAMGMPSTRSTDPVRAIVSINIPLWRERRNAGVREAEARRSTVERQNQAVRQKLTTDIQMALYNYRDSLRKIDLYWNTLIPKAEEALDVSLQTFQAGKRSSADIIDAQQALLEFELAYTRALTDQAKRFAELEMLLGKEIPCEIHGVVPSGAGIRDKEKFPEKL